MHVLGEFSLELFYKTKDLVFLKILSVDYSQQARSFNDDTKLFKLKVKLKVKISFKLVNLDFN